MSFPRLVIAGTHSGSGKTTLTLALASAFSRRGLAVQPFKVGPDYIDPTLHEAATGRFSRNLDAWLLPEATLTALFARHAYNGPDGLNLVEGVMGMFDGAADGPEGSTAHIACLLDAPVLLVINADGLSLSAAALASGYASFTPPLPNGRRLRPRVAGAVFNRVSGERHYTLLRNALAEHCGIRSYGYLAKNACPPLPARRLGLVPAEEHNDLDAFFAALATTAEATLDLDGLYALAANAGRLPAVPDAAPSSSSPLLSAVASGSAASRVRIAVARDAAFCFYYQDNLELLESFGAELVPFSPLHDAALPPDIHGLYAGGGFPDLHAQALEANTALRAQILERLNNGLPALAESGGTLYLCASLRPLPQKDAAAAHRMVGFFSCNGIMEPRLQQPFGYLTAAMEADSALGPAGAAFRAHAFHYFRLESVADAEEPPCCRMEKPDGRAFTGGLCKHRTIALPVHLHFHAAPGLARSFVEACRAHAEQRAAL